MKIRFPKLTHSIRTSVLLILTLNLIATQAILVLVVAHSRAKLRDEVALTKGTALSIRIELLDRLLQENRHDLAQIFAADSNCLTLRRFPEKRSNLEYSYNIYQGFVKRLALNELGEALFLGVEDRVWISFSNEGSFAIGDKLSINQYLKTKGWGEEGYRIVNQFVDINGTWYYLLLFHDNGVYLGEIIKAVRLLEKMDISASDEERLLLFSEQGASLTDADWAASQRIALQDMPNRPYYTTGARSDYIAIRREATQLPGAVVYVTPDAQVLGKLKSITLVWDVFAALTLLMAISSFLAFQGTVLVPFKRLKKAINGVRKGNLNQKIENADNPREIAEITEIYQLFNQMMDRISELKIEAYEEKLKGVDYQMQYFKLQVEPHFYLNCLKCLYAMAENQDYEKMQKMILGMSKCLRSITYDNRATTTVEKELEYVSNYLDIRQLGMADPPECRLSLDYRARECAIPMLCIQTFVENSIKYAGKENGRLIIQIDVSLREEPRCLRIVVKDNGEGYPDSVLEELCNNGALSAPGHIGLSNLWNRLRLIYDGRATMNVTNLPEGGARSELLIPLDSTLPNA